MAKHYTQLTLEEREDIAVLKAKGKSIREMARFLGRSPSTLSRELKRNMTPIYRKPWYLATYAQKKASRRKILAGMRERLKNQEIRAYVTEKLMLHWSPEQIAGRIRIDHPHLKVSHEAIYQFIYEHAWHLFQYLSRKHKRRRFKFYYSKHSSPIPYRTFVGERPEFINDRSQLGHWEADSMVSKANTTAFHVLCERKTRLVKITRISRNASRFVRNAIVSKLASLPPSSRRSITYDNGFENRLHLKINRTLKTHSFFCQPYHSWEKGTVENSIGLIRRFVPKKTDLKKITRGQIGRIENLINNRPRKCLNYQTPQETFNALSDKPLSVALTR